MLGGIRGNSFVEMENRMENVRLDAAILQLRKNHFYVLVRSRAIRSSRRI